MEDPKTQVVNDILPTIIPQNVIVEPIYLDETADLPMVKKADILMFNSQLAMLNSMWTEVRSVKTAMELHDRYMEMIPKRRAILGLEYGSPTNKITRATVFEPVD